MLRRSTSTRTACAVLAAGLGLALVAAVAPASAAPASSDSATAPAAASSLKAAGPYAAAAAASLLTLDIPSLSPALLPQTNVDVGRSTANTESDADVDAAKPGVQRSIATAATTGTTSLLGAPISIQKTMASAPASEAHSDTLIPLDLSPLLDLPIIRTTALANWVSDTECVAADKPLSSSDQALADLTLLGIAPGQTVAELDTGSTDGAVNTQAATYLASIPGGNDARAIQARVKTNVTSIDVLNGLGAPGTAISVRAVRTPNYIVSASGIPGGASVTGADPAVDVQIAGQSLITLDTANQTKDATITDLVLGDLLDISTPGLVSDLVTDLGLGALTPITHPIDQALTTALNALQPVVRLSIPVVKVVNPNGTTASVQAALVRVELLPPSVLGATDALAAALNQILGALGADISAPLLSLDVGPVGASVVAPAGGITCGDSTNPLRELIKHSSATEVAPNGTFEYNISIPNRGPCAVTNTKVTDTVTGPAGFTITGTEPAGTVSGGKVTWDLGTLAPNETRNLTITIKVPGNAPNNSSFDDVVTASGTCDGRPVSQDDRLDNIPVVKRDFTGPCNVQSSNKDASHIQVFPGETFSYYVHAFNSGGQACNDLTITDTLDGRVAFVSCNKGCVNSPANKVTWKLGSLPSGSSVTFAVVVKVADNATGVLGNSAVISPANGSPTTVSTTGPKIGPDSIPKRPASASRRALPRTGGVLPAGLAAGLGLGALALFAVRRRTAVI
jgi:uncharacterized repeat protein (TIGR01451 family)